MRLDHQFIGRQPAIAPLDSQSRTGIALGVEIDNQDLFAYRCEGRCQIDCRRSLAHAAFLICDRDDPILLAYHSATPDMLFLRERCAISRTTESLLDNALVFYQIELEAANGFIEFLLVIPAFMKECTHIGARLHPRQTIFQKLGKFGECAG